jgi:hypothetical protein
VWGEVGNKSKMAVYVNPNRDAVCHAPLRSGILPSDNLRLASGCCSRYPAWSGVLADFARYHSTRVVTANSNACYEITAP